MSSCTPRYFPSRNSQRRTGLANTAKIVPDLISVDTTSAAAQAASRLPNPLTNDVIPVSMLSTKPCDCATLIVPAIASPSSAATSLAAPRRQNQPETEG